MLGYTEAPWAVNGQTVRFDEYDRLAMTMRHDSTDAWQIRGNHRILATATTLGDALATAARFFGAYVWHLPTGHKIYTQPINERRTK